jgi:hypothetical protein
MNLAGINETKDLMKRQNLNKILKSLKRIAVFADARALAARIERCQREQ